MYSFGAKWTGTDISPEQIEQAKNLSQDMGIGYYAMPAEKIENWEREHLRKLRENAPEEFDVLHFAAMAELRKKD